MTILLIILALPIALLIGCWFAFCTCFYSPASHRASPDELVHGQQYDAVAADIARITGIMKRYTFKEVTIRGYDGTKLYGRYYHLKDSAPVEVIFHGYRSHPFRDCSGGHALSQKLGFNTLVVDQRAHGSSGGTCICFGIKERYDCLQWIHYLNEQYGKDIPIILSGLSMGAATVLMSTSLELPANVACIIADSPYSSPRAIIEKVCADRHYPVTICRPFISLAARIFGNFSLDACTAKEAVRNSKVPILLLHGEADHFVPCQMSLEIAANCASRVEVATFPGAGHGLCYMTDPVRYETVVCNFLQSVPDIRDTMNPDYLAYLRQINGK